MNNKKKILNKFTSLFLAILMLVQIPLSSLDVFALGDGNQTTTESIESTETSETTPTTPEENSSEITSNDIGIISIEDDEGEESVDNWELSVVFYDSTVGNGKTALTEINWDASDGGFGQGTARTITVQINYKNRNAITTYAPGELEITIPNLVYGTSEKITYTPSYMGLNYAYIRTGFLDSQCSYTYLLGANDSTHTGYDWNFFNGNSQISSGTPILKFYNANTIEENTNFEGSIKIEFTITPNAESERQLSRTDIGFFDECTHNYSLDLQASLTNIMNSNTISYNYTRTYIHPWEGRTPATLEKTASKITSLDFLPNASDYYWVKYTFLQRNVNTMTFSDEECSPYPYIMAKYNETEIRDILPEGCIVFDKNIQLVETDKEYYSLNAYADHSPNSNYYIVGYPKSIYNEENNNLIITNTADIYGIYPDGNSMEYMNSASVTINLAEFDFAYDGNLYNVNKYGTNGSLRYQTIINNRLETTSWLSNHNVAIWSMSPQVIYSGKPLTLKFGDDLLYITNQDGQYIKLLDSEYCFRQIEFNQGGYAVNGHGNKIETGKYNCEFWIRYSGDTEYTLFESFTYDNSKYYERWTFEESEQVVGFYFIIHDLEESFLHKYPNSKDSGIVKAYTQIKKQDIPENGTIYNFDYLQVYTKDNEGNLILQNEPTIDNYSTLVTKEEIAEYDIATYGTYVQRAVGSKNWNYYNVVQKTNEISVYKAVSSKVIQDANNEKFNISYNLRTMMSGTNVEKLYIDQYNPDYLINGATFYDLLPKGMELESTPLDILNSLTVRTENNVYDSNGDPLNDTDFYSLIKSNTTIEILENWNNTGQTQIKIFVDLSNSPIYVGYYQSFRLVYLNFYYDCSISYDSC